MNLYLCIILISFLPVQSFQEEDHSNFTFDLNEVIEIFFSTISYSKLFKDYDGIYDLLSLDDSEDEGMKENTGNKSSIEINEKSVGGGNNVVIILVFVVLFGVIVFGGIYFYKNKIDPPASPNKETLKRVTNVLISVMNSRKTLVYSFLMKF